MKSHHNSSFQDRLKRAADSKNKALEKLRSRPPVDPTVLAERQATQLKRQAVEADKRAAKAAVARDAKAAKAAGVAAAAAVPAGPTETELKAARDARYAARKKRK